jgi:hypothetical protein
VPVLAPPVLAPGVGAAGALGVVGALGVAAALCVEGAFCVAGALDVVDVDDVDDVVDGGSTGGAALDVGAVAAGDVDRNGVDDGEPTDGSASSAWAARRADTLR